MIAINNLVITRGGQGAALYSSKDKKYFYCPAFVLHQKLSIKLAQEI